MSVRFTPGPWFFAPERAPTSRGFCRIVGSKAKRNRSNLAHVMGLYCDAKGIEADANANLIAAAPELYEAARWALENIQGMIDEDDIPSTVIRDRLRTALARARGETPSNGDAQ